MPVLETIAAASAAVAGKDVFDYNRENFMYDRELRMLKQFQEFKFRTIQSDLWRQDIRDIISLVETKTKKYLLVNVMMMGITVSLWVQGALPETTPDWLMMGNQIAIGGAFSFILLTVWLAMHASISAAGFKTRLLTQLVRLPIPTWEELEAARTYGSSFEKVEARQMFRIPYVMGSQESLVPEPEALATTTPPANVTSKETSALSSAAPKNPTGAASDSAAAPLMGAAGTGSSSAAQVPTDPWGLESRGVNPDQEVNTYELGCPYGKECAKLRHIRLVRQAAQHWQSYDVFARISMSIGVNQLTLAMAYYILGYVLVQVRAPWPAFAGVVALVGLAQILAVLDMSLPRVQQCIITLLIIVGPTFACVACYHWSYHFGVIGNRISRGLAPAAFLSHGLLVLLLSYSCQIKETVGGGLLPTSFKRVLYLDVFGWTGREGVSRDCSVKKEPKRSVSFAPLPAAASQESCCGKLQQNMNHYVLDYLRPPTSDPLLAISDEGSADSELHRAEAGTQRLGDAKPSSKAPCLQAVAYDKRTGQALPTGIKTHRPQDAHQDLRYLAGAPHQNEGISHTSQPKEFFEATSFYPRSKILEQRRLDQAKEDLDPIVSGHDHEIPGRVPSHVFTFGTVLLGSVWIIAATYSLLDSYSLMGYFTGFSIETEGNDESVTGGNESRSSSGSSKLWATSLLQQKRHSISLEYDAEQLDVSVPFSHMKPQGLSCDVDGRHFAVTDGLSTFVGEAARTGMLRGQGSGRTASIKFHEVARCATLFGEALQDTAIACTGSSGKENAACEVLSLHRRGERIASCLVAKNESSAGQGNVAMLSQRWLQKKQKREKASWLLLDSECVSKSELSSRMDCTSVGTTHGRIAHLQHSQSQESSSPVGALFPDAVLPEVSNKPAKGHMNEVRSGGVVRAFNGRYVGVLQRERGRIQVLDTHHNLAKVGSLELPIKGAVEGFCAGGGHLYILGHGNEVQMWRVPLPSQLL